MESRKGFSSGRKGKRRTSRKGKVLQDYGGWDGERGETKDCRCKYGKTVERKECRGKVGQILKECRRGTETIEHQKQGEGYGE